MSMSTSNATDQASQVSAPGPRSRLRGYLVRRGRQLGRALLILLIGLLFMAGLLEAWRGASMLGLPDVGDPFDVAEFQAFRIPPEQDAVALFRRAQEKLTRMPNVSNAASRLGPNVGWSKVAPELRDWVVANRDVLEKFRAASEQVDGIVHSRFDQLGLYSYLNLGEFSWLALLQASRLEEQGDMAGAWTWYRAVFRMKVHVMRRGSVFQRFIAERNCAGLKPQIATWAADRRTSVPLLRQALDDVVAGEPKPEWDAFSLKVDYLAKMNELEEEWGLVPQGGEEDRHFRIFGEELPPNLSGNIYATKRYYSNDPERSRRVLRLAFANWLAHTEEKDPRRLKPAVRAVFGRRGRGSSVYFYDVGPDGPAVARRMAPQRLAEWLVGTRDAKLVLNFWPWPAVRNTERREHRALVVLLAGELYQRDRGTPAPSEQALVGPYLDHLPGDGSDELNDGEAPTVRDDKPPAAAANPG